MLPGYEEGLFFVQDNAARASVKIIGLKPGMRVLDACAAPGGKSMAAALEGADVLSCDVNISRLNRCTENYRRLGMDISTRQMDASTFCTDWSEAFDVVIADVPCSGTGVIRRHPEIRQRSIREVEDLCKMQTIILDNLETILQVTAFLERYPSFSPVPVELKGFDCENGMLRSWPQRSGNDGFFAARLVKKND